MKTRVSVTESAETFAIDHVALPVENPWKRAVRTGDIQFRKDGTAVVVTLDGDVWLARGLKFGSTDVTWRRFASGLHEPMTCAIRDDEIFVFDRNGVWRLRDTDGDGEADRYDVFNFELQTTKNFHEYVFDLQGDAAGNLYFIKAGPVRKGGRGFDEICDHHGALFKVSPDGRKL